MYKYLRLKAVLIVLLVAFALWKAYPPFDQFDKEGNLTKEGTLNLGLDLQGGMYLVLEVDTSELDDEAKKDARERAIEVLRNRLDPQGVKEYPIYPQGRDRIVIQLPGETDRERILKRIKKVAHLEFRLVSDDVDRMKAALDGAPTPGFELLELEEKPILLESRSENIESLFRFIHFQNYLPDEYIRSGNIRQFPFYLHGFCFLGDSLRHIETPDFL